LELVLKFPLASMVRLFREFGVLEYKNFIRHGFQVAKITREILKRLALSVDLDCAYLAGLFHDIGLAVKASLMNYELFKDMFRNFSDLEKLVLTFDKSNDHPMLSYLIAMRVKPLCPRCAKAILYHHTPYQMIDESDDLIRILANSIRIADMISIAHIKSEDAELKPDLFKSIFHFVDNEAGTLEEVNGVTMDILKDYRVLNALLDDDEGFTSSKTLSLDEIEGFAEVIAALIDLRSPYTRNHTFLTFKFSEIIAQELLSEEDAKLINISALFHDVGKIKTPLEVLHKKGPLDDTEALIMRMHVVDTYEMLKRAGLEHLGIISAAHHERLDGTGYPLGLTGDRLSLSQRILQVCDVFSALVEERPYRPKMSPLEALSVIERDVKGGKLDGRVYLKLKELCDRDLLDYMASSMNILEGIYGPNYEDVAKLLGIAEESLEA